MRDTWEVPKSKISIDQSRWAETLAVHLNRIRRDLGLPDGYQLKAQLHNMRVYGPGQFFAAHQDSVKTDDMIATLVVSLPSRFTGGLMTIENLSDGKLRRCHCLTGIVRVQKAFRVTVNG